MDAKAFVIGSLAIFKNFDFAAVAQLLGAMLQPDTRDFPAHASLVMWVSFMDAGASSTRSWSFQLCIDGRQTPSFSADHCTFLPSAKLSDPAYFILSEYVTWPTLSTMTIMVPRDASQSHSLNIPLQG